MIDSLPPSAYPVPVVLGILVTVMLKLKEKVRFSLSIEGTGTWEFGVNKAGRCEDSGSDSGEVGQEEAQTK